MWQLLDSGFPSGGFAHSAGLEAACSAGEIPQEQQLLEFTELSLRQAGRARLPFVMACYDDVDRFATHDRVCDAFMSNHIANEASRAQGEALLDSSVRIFDRGGLRTLQQQTRAAGLPTHYPVAFGAVFHALELSRADTAQAFLFATLRDLIAAAVRLNATGALRGQQVLDQLADVADAVAEDCRDIPVEDAAQVAPMIELFQGTHRDQYAKLFRS